MFIYVLIFFWKYKETLEKNTYAYPINNKLLNFIKSRRSQNKLKLYKWVANQNSVRSPVIPKSF